MSRANPRYKRINPSGTSVSGLTAVEYLIYGLIEGQLTINVFYYVANSTVLTNTNLVAALTAMSTNTFAKYKACISVDWTCTKEVLNVVSINTQLGVVSTANAGAAGGRTTPHLPTENAIILIKRSTLKGQHGRGRISLPAVAAADVTGSTITVAAELTALGLLATAMASTLTDGVNQYTPAVAQRSTASPKLVTFYSAITSVTVNPVIGTIRRRRLGRGK